MDLIFEYEWMLVPIICGVEIGRDSVAKIKSQRNRVGTENTHLSKDVGIMILSKAVKCISSYLTRPSGLESRIRMLEGACAEREAVVRARESTIQHLEFELASAEHSLNAVMAQLRAQECDERDPPEGSVLDLKLPLRNQLTPDVIGAVLSTLEGWCTQRKALRLIELIMDSGAKDVLEIGVFGGASLIPMALALKDCRGTVVGVEAWDANVATSEATTEENDKWWHDIDICKIKAGFWDSVKRYELFGIIKILEMDSDRAYECLSNGNRRFELIHVDGAHAENQALRDVRSAMSILGRKDIIVLDDIEWPTVEAARALLRSTMEVIDEVHESDATAYGIYRSQD